MAGGPNQLMSVMDAYSAPDDSIVADLQLKLKKAEVAVLDQRYIIISSPNLSIFHMSQLISPPSYKILAPVDLKKS